MHTETGLREKEAWPEGLSDTQITPGSYTSKAKEKKLVHLLLVLFHFSAAFKMPEFIGEEKRNDSLWRNEDELNLCGEEMMSHLP